LRARGLGAVALAAVAVFVVAGFYTVRPSEAALVLRFGSPVQPVRRSGIHWRWPGVDRVLRVEITRPYTMPVGFRTADEVRGVAAQTEESKWLTGDTNSLSVQLTLQYQVADPAAFLLGSEDPPAAVRRGAEAAVTEALGSLPVDDVLTTGRVVFLDRVRRETQAFLNGSGSGIQILSVALRSVEPPEPVRAAFQDVQNARSDREKLINDATGYANETLPRSRGEAETLSQLAQSDRTRRIEQALGDAHRFEALRKEAARDQDLLRERVYLETMQRVLPRTRLFVIEGKGSDTRIRVFDPPLPTPETTPPRTEFPGQ
jgi:modulator of FtsH protease HflK